MNLFGSLFTQPAPIDPAAVARRKQEEAFDGSGDGTRRGAVYPQLNDESVVARIRNGKIIGFFNGTWMIAGSAKTDVTPHSPGGAREES